MFCPNCGTENEETATPCKRCGFKLRGVSAPKFKGTMLLNSDQAVQKLVQEARRRLEEGSSADLGQTPLPQNGGPPVAWGNQAAGLRTLNGGLQPPRVTSPRVGRTMMGVAPQIGGYAPQNLEADPEVAEPEPNLGQVARTSPSPLPSETAPTSSHEAARREGAHAAQLLGLDAVAANDGPGQRPAGAVHEAPASAAAKDSANSEMQVSAIAQSTSAETAAPRPGDAGPALASERPRPLYLVDIILILVTFGLYGLVLWARQRKQAAKRTPEPPA